MGDGARRETLHYLTCPPIYIDGKRVTGKGKTAMGEAKGLEDLHVIAYDTRTGGSLPQSASASRDMRN